MSGDGEVRSAGDELARKRLAAYAHLAELVLEQEAALEREDMERFDELTETVTELRGRLGTVPSGLEGVHDLGGLGPDHADEAASLLRATLARTERIQSRLMALRTETAGEIRRVGSGRTTGRRYLEASGSGPSSSSPRVDVKL